MKTIATDTGKEMEVRYQGQYYIRGKEHLSEPFADQHPAVAFCEQGVRNGATFAALLMEHPQECNKGVFFLERYIKS